MHSIAEFVPRSQQNLSNISSEAYIGDSIAVPENAFGFVASVPVDGGDRYGVSAVSFDTREELLWMGNSGGHVTSYFGPGLEKYTSFQVHVFNEIRQLVSWDAGLLELTRNHLKCNSRQGVGLFCHTSSNFGDMQCMTLSSPQTLVVGGHQQLLCQIDLGKVEEVQVVQIKEHDCAIMRQNEKFLCTGDTQGKIAVRDPTSLQAVHVFEAHKGTLSDFDVCGHKLVTCGFSNRVGQLTCDRFLMVYDLRTFRPMTPLHLPFEPTFVRFLPLFSDSRLLVASQTGEFEIFEMGATLGMYASQIQTGGAAVVAMDVSMSKQAVAFGDSGGMLHLFADREQFVYNDASRPTEFPDPITPQQPMSFKDEVTALSYIPLPMPTSRLLSDWPLDLCTRVYRRPMPIDPQILAQMRVVQFIGYAPNLANRRRNQVPYDLRHQHGYHTHHNRYADVESPPLVEGSALVPKLYRRILLKPPKIGMEDAINYAHCNRTPFTGLECNVPNAYCNALLLVLYHIKPLHNAIVSHLCKREHCLTCEMSFLFDMLRKAAGRQPCVASNFIRSLRTIPEAAALDVVLNDRDESSLKLVNVGRLIQNLNRFLLRQVSQELDTASDFDNYAQIVAAVKTPEDGTDILAELSEEQVAAAAVSNTISLEDDSAFAGAGGVTGLASATTPRKRFTIVEKLFALDVTTSFRCHCESQTVRDDTLLVLSLTYPSADDALTQPTSFSSILKSSLCSETTSPAWCEKCAKYQSTLQKRRVVSLPPILAIMCRIETEKDKRFWAFQQNTVGAEQKEQGGGSNTSTTRTGGRSVKPCKYGKYCTRLDCKYMHDNDHLSQTDALGTGNHGHWVPLVVEIAVDESGLVSVTEMDNVAAADSENNIDSKTKRRYELRAVVCMVQDRDADHLVTLLKPAAAKDAVTTTSTVPSASMAAPSREAPAAEDDVGGNTSEADDERSEVGSEDSPSETAVSNSVRTSSSGAPAAIVGSQPAAGRKDWVLFNDQAVAYVHEGEAVHFPPWKVPCMLYYVDTTVETDASYAVPAVDPITPTVFTQDECLAVHRRLSTSAFVPLAIEEIPRAGELVAIDAEFVTVNQEEAELRSDGSKSMIKPSQVCLARVTCLRGNGPGEGTPFIDDYIATQEEVVDYLTEVSGIKPGDLDRERSSKHLTTLKSTYVKLRYLADHGAVFVGHGLKNDFRVINLLVPSSQIIDTVHLFHLRQHRMISLRFLAWYFFGTIIQAETHDSVEDAKTALRLYRKYQDLSRNGSAHLSQVLNELYEEGRRLQWKIPEESLSSSM